jgi:uncharacterized Zn finger protein
VIKIDNRRKEFMENRRIKRKGLEKPQKKNEYEKERTREEVEQIKKNLINYAKTSWGKQWIQSNLQIGRPFRMQRGIEYVKDERRIENLSINTGQIFATVQGTAPTPYRVKINFEPILEEGWKIILQELAKKTINLIELLEGFLPEDIITIFDENGYSVFPNTSKGLNATCSCPDTAIPCKHIAAVILYLARVLDYNPFLLLELQGKSKSEILNELNLGLGAKNKKEPAKASTTSIFEFKFNVPKISVVELSSEQKNSDTDIDDYNIGFTFRKPGKIIETLENLGVPQTIENKAFEIVLRAIYRKITEKIHDLSLELS